MALVGRAPKVLTFTFKKGPMSGVPGLALAVTMVFPCLAFLQCSSGSEVVLNWLINLVTAGGVITYIVMATTYIFFYKAVKAQGLDRRTFPYRGWLQPYCAYIGLVWMIMIVTCYGYSAYAPWDTQTWFIYYAMLVLGEFLAVSILRHVLHCANLALQPSSITQRGRSSKDPDSSGRSRLISFGSGHKSIPTKQHSLIHRSASGVRCCSWLVLEGRSSARNGGGPVLLRGHKVKASSHEGPSLYVADEYTILVDSHCVNVKKIIIKTNEIPSTGPKACLL
jgi:hypothetical protein